MHARAPLVLPRAAVAVAGPDHARRQGDVAGDGDALASLQAFRQAAHACFDRRSDALCDLCDAILTAGPRPSLAHLSLTAAHRRGWGSLYAALQHGRIDDDALHGLLPHYLLEGGQPVYAVDVSVWPRCEAETSPGRGFYYHPSRHLDGTPVVKGWAYQWIAQLGFAHESWTAPLDVQRVPLAQTPTVAAIAQVKALLGRLPPSSATLPLFVFDAGYDQVELAHQLGDASVALLIRLYSNRCFYGEPPAVTGTREGRPRQDGAKFACDDPTTWPEPSATYRCEDERYGAVWVQAWADLHTPVRRPKGQGTYKPRPRVRGTIIRIEVARLPGQTRKPQVLWLWWQGSGAPDLAFLWRAYVRRYDIEQTFRFLKGSLNWVTPRVRHPEQADRWTWLVAAAYTQLRLARACVADRRLPWERPQEATRFTPERVQRGFVALTVELGTPAAPPKPCGRSPGRPRGRLSGRARRYPAVKKSA